MPLIDHQPEALAALDAVLERAQQVIDPRLFRLACQRVDHIVADGPQPDAPVDAREAAACEVIEQALLDVAGLDDAIVRHASGYFADGELADLVMGSYAYEASVRLRVAGNRLLGVCP